MVRISGVNSIGFGSNILHTKRSKIDNSEMYIDSKLADAYQRTMADSFVASKLNSLRQFTKDDTRTRMNYRDDKRSFDKTI